MQGNCLKNKPKLNLLLTVNWTNLVGSYTSLNEHCQLVNDASYKQCLKESSCGVLFCGNRSYNCQRQPGSQLEGGICYQNGYCFLGQCYKTKPEAIHGGWNQWSPYGQCTRPCGGGVKVSTRKCDSPKPQNDGSYCFGPGKRYKSCNTKPCSINEPDFRTQQCQKQGFKMAIYERNATCALSCTNYGTVGRRLGSVIDGTRCSLLSCGICINGICRKADCKNVINNNPKSYRKRQKGSSGPILEGVRKLLENFSKQRWSTFFKMVSSIFKTAHNY